MKRPKIEFLAPVAMSVSCAIILESCFCNGLSCDFYDNDLSSCLFSGLLTLAAFILAFKTFLIVFLKETLYDRQSQLDNFIDRTNGKPPKEIAKLSLYDGLHRLSNLLSSTILTCLVAGLFQLAIHVSKIKEIISLAAGLSISGIAMVFLSWYYIQANLNTYFESIKNEGEEKIKKRKSERDKIENEIAQKTGITIPSNK